VIGRNVRIEVSDGDSHRPEPQQVGPQSLRGRGLQIVDTASDRWGVRAAGEGKAVWFEIALAVVDDDDGR
jgi:hypothetical protein